MLSTWRIATHAGSARCICANFASRKACSGQVARRPAAVVWTCHNGGRRLFTSLPSHTQHLTAASEIQSPSQEANISNLRPAGNARNLPLTCPGCGALSQTIDPEAAGFYGSKRAAKDANGSMRARSEDDVFQKALKYAVLPDLPIVSADVEAEQPPQTTRAICDRCHYLLYQSRGTSIVHPTMQSIQQIIEESPHRHNHIYHVLDAADFPMSLIPNLQHALKLPRLRTQNRRSKTVNYIRGREAEVSFIITRSDLLAPKKEQVDSLLPYLREVLRDALGKSGKNVRLGNVRLVSAQRGWWTRTVKEDIWNRGGAGWMVGKVNVGKSALYEVVFPKGRNEVDTDVNRLRDQERRAVDELYGETGEAVGIAPVNAQASDASPQSSTFFSPFGSLDALIDDHIDLQSAERQRDNMTVVETNEPFFDEGEDGSLLPPAQPETAFPQMPLVSALPGTTASPIRIPFGNGKGELIDLPGVHRSSLDAYIKPEHHKSLVMKSRLTPEQYTIKPGQSLLIGGVVRITPKTDDLIFLAYPFVPLKSHVTSNEKATAIQTGVTEDGSTWEGNVDTISTDAAKDCIKTAGTFQLEWDVTKRRTGSLTNKAAGKIKTADLPFTVHSADILIEGVGWIELTCQVRRRRSPTPGDAVDASGIRIAGDTAPALPEVEVFTPEGKFVAVRRPMNAWVLGGPKKPPKHLRRSRPRQSISMAKRRLGGTLGQQMKASTLVD